MAVHTCRQVENPRHPGYCACGQRLPVEREPATRQRIPSLEREYVEHATRGLVDPEPLIQHSQARALRQAGEYVQDGMVRRVLGLGWLKEMREELADASNHGTWLLEDVVDHPDRENWRRALAYVALAYDLLRQED